MVRPVVLGAGEPVGERRGTREGLAGNGRAPRGSGRGGREAGAWGARGPPASGSPPLPSGGSLRSAYLTCRRPQRRSHFPTTRLPVGSARPLSPWRSSGGCCPSLWRWPWAPLAPQRAPPGLPTSWCCSTAASGAGSMGKQAPRRDRRDRASGGPSERAGGVQDKARIKSRPLRGTVGGTSPAGDGGREVGRVEEGQQEALCGGTAWKS